MKVIILAFTSMLAFAGTASAQKISFGIKGGISHNQLTYSVDQETEDGKLEGTNTGFFIGAMAQVPLSEHFALQPNLLFAAKGGAVAVSNLSKVNTLHIELPVNFLYTTNGFFIGGGPNFSYAMSGNINVQGKKLDIFDIEEADMLTLKKFEIGANILMGYTLPNGITFSANFTPGLNNIYNGEETPNTDVTSHFKSFGFSIGYLFNAKGK